MRQRFSRKIIPELVFVGIDICEKFINLFYNVHRNHFQSRLIANRNNYIIIHILSLIVQKEGVH